MTKEIVIAGAGFTGAYIARNLAELGWQVHVIEKRNHIAGNMYDEVDKSTGCLVHKYGPHIFHTNDDEIWSWLNKFAEFTPFSLKTQVYFESQRDWFTCSFGFHTIEQLFDENKAKATIERLKLNYPNKDKVTIPELMNSKDPLIKEFVEILWAEDYKPYTSKQWGLSPDDVDIDILKRVPVYLNYFDKIHDKKYEALPVNGYTSLFESILNHKNITVHLSTDVFDSLEINYGTVYYKGNPCQLVFTGAIDELFKYKYGPLNYRSLKFIEEVISNDKSAKEGTPCVDIYPNEKYPFTRITNYGKLPIQNNLDNQICMKEYPLNFKPSNNMERYYPTSTEKDKETFEKYKSLSKEIKGLYLSGRLADYKYYDMDKALMSARNTLNEILEANN